MSNDEAFATGSATVHEAVRGYRIPGDPGVWVIIFGEMIVFGIFFVVYAVYRSYEPAVFSGAQESMRRLYGMGETMLLLTSSCFVALAVETIRLGERTAAAPKLISYAVMCGCGFCCLKALEYKEKFDAGLTLNKNLFFTFYYMLTGIHLIHVIVGLGLLLFMRTLCTKVRTAPGKNTLLILESCGIFWHLVDLLWIFLFAILYVAR